MDDTAENTTRFVNTLIKQIDNLLHETECIEYPKARVYRRVRHSVTFHLPLVYEDGGAIVWRKGVAPSIMPASELATNEYVIYAPFTVESGEQFGDFIARD